MKLARIVLSGVAFVIFVLRIGPATGLSTRFGVSVTAQGNGQPPWTLVWNDEFDGPANTAINTDAWIYDLGTGYGCAGCPSNWGTGEVETMTDSTSNVYQDGAGHLVIKPIHLGDLPSGGWTSGRVETMRTDFRAPAGGILAVEASIHQPNITGTAAAGYWPAFWMLGEQFRGNYLNWPGVGEIDIMENTNGLSSVFGTLHCGTYPGGPCNEPAGRGGRRECLGCLTSFHTYRVELDRSVNPEQIRWYLDGENYFTVNSGQFAPATWADATNHGFFIIINLAIGGGFPAAFGGGPTSSTVAEVPILVDYVRVYVQHKFDAVISDITPPSMFQGSSTRAIVTGANLLNAAAITFAGQGVSATILNGGTSTSVPVQITTELAAAAGMRRFTVTTPAGTSNPLDGFMVKTEKGIKRFSLPARGAASLATSGDPPKPVVGYVEIQPDEGSEWPTLLAILGFHRDNILVSESAFQAAPPIQTGRVYAEVTAAANTGIAMVNANIQPATVRYIFTDATGKSSNGVGTIRANGQISAFLNEAPFDSGFDWSGTFTFNSSLPISVIALHGSVNERSDFLTSMIPVIDLTAERTNPRTVIPHFASGGGWATRIVLVNPTGNVLTGGVEFRNSSGLRTVLTLDGRIGDTSAYSIPPRSARSLQIAGDGSSTGVGSVRIIPAATTDSPVGFAVVSFHSNGITVAETAIPAVPKKTGFRFYAETLGDIVTGGSNSIETALAVANEDPNPAIVTFELYKLDGSPIGRTATVSIPGNGQIAVFLSEIFAGSFQKPFQGVLRISSTAAISAVAVRIRFTERREFHITAMPSTDQSLPAATPALFLPQFVVGGGYTTQFLLFSNNSGQPMTGALQIFSQSGEVLELPLQ